MKLINLPVFELRGAERQDRKDFLGKLTSELARYNLLCTVVSPPDLASSQYFLALTKTYDVVFIDGKTDLSLQTIFLMEPGDGKTTGAFNCVLDSERSFSVFLDLLLKRLQEINLTTPVWGCILIGGKSSRMGQPKHLIEGDDGRTWLEYTVDRLKPLVDGLVISGAGAIPGSLSNIRRLPDIPGVAGPLSGILAATRWQAELSWLLVACDMPHISREAVEWLLASRCPGHWGVVPRMAEAGYVEPLFAWYDMRAGHIFEGLLQEGVMRIGRAAHHRKIVNPTIPESLRYVWDNVNTPEQLLQAHKVG